MSYAQNIDANPAVVEKQLLHRFIHTRQQTEIICQPLDIEDYVVQPITDVSPPKWHLGHTTWFFENFILIPFKKDYKIFDKDFNFIFNSYYESVGARVMRTDRGNLTRPSIEKIAKYRTYIQEHIAELISTNNLNNEIINLLELGINHEQQHQELLITDIKYILGNNPLFPAYFKEKDKPHIKNTLNNEVYESYHKIDEGVYEIGYKGSGFCFDNEKEPHKVYVHSFEVAGHLVTNEEYLEFIEAGGYLDFRYWLSEGWEWVKLYRIQAPLYWHNIDGKWFNYTFFGLAQIEPQAPVTHISYFEAEAFAQWKGRRLLTEFEWEVACNILNPEIPLESNFMESGYYTPVVKQGENLQFFGDVWEWTQSAYLPYPYYKKEEGALGEYNGKFMINQMVLRGGSCATPKSHIRPSYRNFWHTDKRWQFTGIRLGGNIK